MVPHRSNLGDLLGRRNSVQLSEIGLRAPWSSSSIEASLHHGECLPSLPATPPDVCLSSRDGFSSGLLAGCQYSRGTDVRLAIRLVEVELGEESGSAAGEELGSAADAAHALPARILSLLEGAPRGDDRGGPESHELGARYW